jgi:hypothetical protein
LNVTVVPLTSSCLVNDSNALYTSRDDVPGYGCQASCRDLGSAEFSMVRRVHYQALKHDEKRKGPVGVGGSSAGPLLFRVEPSAFVYGRALVHSAHAAARHRRFFLLFRNIADERFGGE